MSRPLRHHRFWLLLIFLAAAALRLYGLNNVSPPGLAHDEVANWLIDRAILRGEHAIYFTTAYGHEAGFHYLQAAYVALLGDHALALRLPAAHAGLLLVAVVYGLARQLFGRRTALLAAGWLAFLFYPVFYSRLGLRAITLPLTAGLSAYFWWRGWRLAERQGPGRRLYLWFGLAGLWAGISAHTYMAARAVPIFYGLFILYLALFHRPVFRRAIRPIALFALLYALVAAPLVIYLLTNPGSEARVSEVSAPLEALLAGDPLPALTNSLKILGIFGWRGDPLWRQNVVPRAVFEPVTALLFYGGLALALWRWRDARSGFLLLWLSTAAIPSIVTIDAPSSIRIANSLVVITLFPAILMHSFPGLSPDNPHLSTGVRKSVHTLLLGLWAVLLLWNGVRTLNFTFRVWPENPEVAFVWQEALTDAAAYLDAAESGAPVAVGGWTPETMDPPTMALSLEREDLALRFFQPQRAVVIPAGNAPRVLWPTILPPDPLLLERLDTWLDPVVIAEFTLYAANAAPRPAPTFPSNTTFGQELRLLGYDAVPSEQGLALVTYWRVLAPPAAPRRLFLHLVDGGGGVLAQDDGLDAPAAHWRAGDLVVQRLSLPVPSSEAVGLRLGVYQPNSAVRLQTSAGVDALALPLP